MGGDRSTIRISVLKNQIDDSDFRFLGKMSRIPTLSHRNPKSKIIDLKVAAGSWAWERGNGAVESMGLNRSGSR